MYDLQDSCLEEARRLLDALEAELRAADEEAAAAGTAPNARVPLSEPPAALANAQVRNIPLRSVLTRMSLCGTCHRALTSAVCHTRVL